MAVLSSFVVSLCVVFGTASDLAGFDAAEASSTYSDAFAPSSAIHGGAGYWCSAGGHGATQVDQRKTLVGIHFTCDSSP